MDIDGANPQFTLTCISTGGPATTVSWTRDSTTVNEGNETVLLNPITTEYLHTLKVTGDIKGRYTCTVANNKPSNASATLECEVVCNLVEIVYCRAFSSDPVQPIIILVAKSVTSLNINWEVTNATDDTYTVEWKRRGCLAENKENSGSITTNDTSYSIIGLKEGSKYNITVSAGTLSNTVSAVTIEKGQGVVLMSFSNFISLAPSAAPRVSWIFATSYSITLQWETVPCEHRNGDITGYSVKCGEMGSLDNASETLINITGASVTEATISNLMLDTNYFIRVAAVNNAGIGVFSNAKYGST